MNSSDKTADRARSLMPGGVSSGQRAVPGLDELVVVEARGAEVWDEAGRSYVDFHLAFGPIVLGHADPEVDAAAAATARRIDLVGVGRTREEVALAELIVECVPSIESVLFTASGSEATYHALRLARAATGRPLVVKFEGCYHGWHDAVALSVAPPPELVGAVAPMSAGMVPGTVASTVVLPFNDLDAVAAFMRERGGEVAAIILEPIPHSIGVVLPRPGFLAGLRALCSEHGAVLVFDEIVTGFRHGLAGIQGIEGVEPDLTTLGKAMANGYPVAALGGRRDLMELFSTRPGGEVLFQGTYNGHPLCMTAALATIEKLRREDAFARLDALGARARRLLDEALADVGTPTCTVGRGSIFVTYFMEPPVECYADLLRNDAGLYVGHRRLSLAEGLLQLPLNLKRNQVCLAHTDEHVERLAEATRRSVLTCLERAPRGGAQGEPYTLDP